jgi:hypothetical protein
VLTALTERGLLKHVVGVVMPTSQTLYREFFDSVEDIPPCLSDPLDNRFDTDDAEVVPVYRGATD